MKIRVIPGIYVGKRQTSQGMDYTRVERVEVFRVGKILMWSFFNGCSVYTLENLIASVGELTLLGELPPELDFRISSEAYADFLKFGKSQLIEWTVE